VAGLNHSSDGPSAPKAPPRYGVLFYLGAGGLLVAMSIEAIAVAGRQIGVPLLGALEIIQTAILVTASAAMLSATLADAHASVRLLVERLSPRTQQWLHRIAMLVAAAFFACLAVAAGWLTLDAWNEFEHSELLHIPYRPLRVIVVVMTAAIAVTFIYKVARPAAQHGALE
jgi:TRAP-type C4-dicarboxylate transport system permease small subunit